MNHTTRTARRAGFLPAALALGLSLAAAASAQAEMISSQPGTVCTPINADRSKVTYSATLGVYNNSTSASAKVHCPVLYNTRDFDINSGIFFTSAGIFVTSVDPNPATGAANDLSCQAFGLNPSGTIGFTTSTVTSANGGDLNVTYADGSTGLAFNMVCTLPHKFNNVPFSIASMRVMAED
jgi:hypothetical protein